MVGTLTGGFRVAPTTTAGDNPTRKGFHRFADELMLTHDAQPRRHKPCSLIHLDHLEIRGTSSVCLCDTVATPLS
jgi:hypothetical protein